MRDSNHIAESAVAEMTIGSCRRSVTQNKQSQGSREQCVHTNSNTRTPKSPASRESKKVAHPYTVNIRTPSHSIRSLIKKNS